MMQRVMLFLRTHLHFEVLNIPDPGAQLWRASKKATSPRPFSQDDWKNLPLNLLGASVIPFSLGFQGESFFIKNWELPYSDSTK